MTADRKADQLPTTVDGAPVASVAPGPLPVPDGENAEEGVRSRVDRNGDEANRRRSGEGVMEVDDVR